VIRQQAHAKDEWARQLNNAIRFNFDLFVQITIEFGFGECNQAFLS